MGLGASKTPLIPLASLLYSQWVFLLLGSVSLFAARLAKESG